jgi:two-component system sensor histidine kinase PilS (NtrC family)
MPQSVGTTFDEHTWLTWLVKVRILIITFLLGIELVVVNFTVTDVPLRLFVTCIVLWYTVALFLMVLLSVWREYQLQAKIQVLTDLAFATIVLYLTGGIDTSFNFLYPLVIIITSVILSRTWAYIVALLSFILFGAILELSFFEIVPSYSVTHVGVKGLQAVIFINLFAYLAIAYLATRLAAKLRQFGVQLEIQSGELENLQALHENIVNSISSGIITTTLDGRITHVNPAAERLLQRRKEEILATPVGQLILDRLPHVQDVPLHLEVRSATPRGAQRTFAVTASALTIPERGTLGYVYALDDLTEIRRLEREIRLRDRMSAVGRLANAIAHEIRQPLTSISGSVELLADIGALDEEQRVLTDVVQRESERLNKIITEFLQYSREVDYHFGEHNLVALLDDSIRQLHSQPEFEGTEPKIKTVRDISVEHAPALVDGDRIRQVFSNLAGNAVQAMRGSGTLTISLRGDPENWTIEFSDTGPAIPSHLVDKIFEPYQSRVRGGTGLGLAIVYQIVQAHDAKITVQSEPDQGTRFTLTLKRNAETAHVQTAGSGGRG